jgi:hypothetical protein
MNIMIRDRNTLSKTQAHQLPRYRRLLNGLLSMLTTLIERMIHEPEVKVWQHRDRIGNITWHVYNPRTGESAVRETEAEIVDWIERSFYR